VNFFLLLAASQDIEPAETPQLQSIGVVSVTAGACDGNVVDTPAAISVAWTADNFDDAVHAFKVYENDVLKVQQTTTSWQKTINGFIEDGPYQRFESDWTYRVDVVYAATGVVLSSITASPWSVFYGQCRDMGVPE
jgi:hypothetical protein